MSAITQQGIIEAKIESGRVLDVDINSYTVTVTTQYSKKPQSGITWSSPYSHFVNGEGLYCMPEVGSLCWICFPSDGNRPFVLGWAPAGDEGDYRARRRDLNPGDIFMGTRDDNFIFLRRGGIVQIGGSALCQRMYLPVTNTIKDFCENYNLFTLAGDLVWSVEGDENTTDGKRPGHLVVSAREFANDAAPIAQIKVGSHGDSDKTILSLLIKDQGTENAARQVSLTIDKDGNVSWEVKKDVTWKVEGKYSIESTGDMSLKSGAKVTVEGGTTVEVTGKTGVKIVGSTGMVEITGTPMVKAGPILSVGNAPQPVLLATPTLVWLGTHTHPVSGAVTGPPAVPPPAPTMTATTLLASPS